MLDFHKFVEKIGFFVIESPNNWKPWKNGLTSQKIWKIKLAVQRLVYQSCKELTEGIFWCTIQEVENREYTLGEFCLLAEDSPLMNEQKFKSQEEK